MKLSELLIMDTVPAACFGVVVDVPDFTVPKGLDSVGFTYLVKDGEIDEVLLDIAISYKLAGIEVLFEVPAEVAIADMDHLLALASNIGVSLALLPPSAGTDEDHDLYRARVLAAADAYLSSANYAGCLLPVTSYLEYLFREAAEPGLVFEVTHPYMRDQFVSRVPEAVADQFKAALRARFEQHFAPAGGTAAFFRVVQRQIGAQVLDNTKDLISKAQQSAVDAS